MAENLLLCRECGLEFEDIWEGKESCPNCMSDQLDMVTRFEEKVAIHELIRGKIIDPSRKSSEKTRQETIDGEVFGHREGKYLRKYRLIDRDDNHYKELVVDPDSGETIHYDEGTLSNHTGHGSAKRKKP